MILVTFRNFDNDCFIDHNFNASSAEEAFEQIRVAYAEDMCLNRGYNLRDEDTRNIYVYNPETRLRDYYGSTVDGLRNYLETHI